MEASKRILPHDLCPIWFLGVLTTLLATCAGFCSPRGPRYMNPALCAVYDGRSRIYVTCSSIYMARSNITWHVISLQKSWEIKSSKATCDGWSHPSSIMVRRIHGMDLIFKAWCVDIFAFCHAEVFHVFTLCSDILYCESRSVSHIVNVHVLPNIYVTHIVNYLWQFQNNWNNCE